MPHPPSAPSTVADVQSNCQAEEPHRQNVNGSGKRRHTDSLAGLKGSIDLDARERDSFLRGRKEYGIEECLGEEHVSVFPRELQTKSITF